MGRQKKKTADFSNTPLEGLSALKEKLKTQEEIQQQKAIEEEKRKKRIQAEKMESPADESALFKMAMSDVTPLDSSETTPLRKKSRNYTPKNRSEEESLEVFQTLQNIVSGDAPIEIHETDEAIEGSVRGLSQNILEKLRKRKFSIQAHLDLHGLNVQEAREKVEAFISRSISQGKRCVLIIHGRGYGSKDNIPVLKNSLKIWLTRRALRKKILAFTTARQSDGGAGAIYVLLRK